ncbi:unnamed protein product [Sphenostylis stenocarpa]|uniref:Uncharacterized protein n=1 Tax=Sphenostylis stenocarpa TaxID=92480 RepID=A0AA86TB00_9FABA|nr:unnamed protein product [Sphenostylis stenocarpa]
MVRFIRQEAEEKANEIFVSTEEEFNIEKLQLVEADKKKIRQEYKCKERQVKIHKKMLITKRSRAHGLVEGILERVLINLHSIQKNLQFWKFRAKRSDSEKARFMIFERGPRAFIDETVKLLRGLTA